MQKSETDDTQTGKHTQTDLAAHAQATADKLTHTHTQNYFFFLNRSLIGEARHGTETDTAAAMVS